MSVLIKGMEMPDKCGHCRFATAFDCMATGSFISEHSIRQQDCPLVPVPDHGRLIDADALLDKHFGKDYLEKAMTASKDEMGIALVNIPLVINNAPTIIPADPAEEGET